MIILDIIIYIIIFIKNCQIYVLFVLVLLSIYINKHSHSQLCMWNLIFKTKLAHYLFLLHIIFLGIISGWLGKFYY